METVLNIFLNVALCSLYMPLKKALFTFLPRATNISQLHLSDSRVQGGEHCVLSKYR